MARTAAARASGGRVVFEEIHAYCVSHADAVRAQRYARFFTEGYDAYGVDHRDPGWEPTRLRWSARLRELGPQAFVDCANLLVRTGKYEEASFAILIAADLPEFDSTELFTAIGGWFDCGGIRNWAHTDIVCGMVLSRYLKNGVIGLPDLAKWRDSALPYKRRAAAVTLVESLGHCNTREWLTFVEPLMTDTEKAVHQGVGWFLREVWKKDKEPVEALLMKWKDTAPRLIYQYATEKMSPSERQRFRRSRG